MNWYFVSCSVQLQVLYWNDNILVFPYPVFPVFSLFCPCLLLPFIEKMKARCSFRLGNVSEFSTHPFPHSNFCFFLPFFAVHSLKLCCDWVRLFKVNQFSEGHIAVMSLEASLRAVNPCWNSTSMAQPKSDFLAYQWKKTWQLRACTHGIRLYSKKHKWSELHKAHRDI